MSENLKIGDNLLVIFKQEGEVNSTIIDIIDDNKIVVQVRNNHYIAELDSERMWVVSEDAEPTNESLLRSNSKKQMTELNKTIKRSGGDIQDRVRKGEKRKENKMPNAYYMDNPFDARRKSIDTWEDFTKKDAHYKSEPMKSRDPRPNRPHTDSRLAKVYEHLSGPLKTMPAHHQTYIYPNLTEDEQTLLKELDIALYKFNFDNETKVMMSFKSPRAKGEAYELMLINVSVGILNDVIELIKEFDFEHEYDGKGRLFLDVYYYDVKRPTSRRINEAKKEKIIPTTKLNNLKNFYQICMDDESLPNRVCKKSSDIKDDSWVKGDAEELRKPMFKNLPDAKIRTPYDGLRAGKWVNIDGIDCRINGLDKNKVFVDIVDEDNKHRTVEYNIKDFLKKVAKSKKKLNENVTHDYVEMMDYLKASCRSWEYDCDNEDDTLELANHLSNKFPEIPFDDIYTAAKNWTGYEDEGEDSYLYGDN